MISGGLGSMKEDSFRKKMANTHERGEVLRGNKVSIEFSNSLVFFFNLIFLRVGSKIYLF